MAANIGIGMAALANPHPNPLPGQNSGSVYAGTASSHDMLAAASLADNFSGMHVGMQGDASNALGRVVDAVTGAIRQVGDAIHSAVENASTFISVNRKMSQWIDGHIDPDQPLHGQPTAATMRHHVMQRDHNGVVSRIMMNDIVDSRAVTCEFYGPGTSLIRLPGNLMRTLLVSSCGLDMALKQWQLLREGVSTPVAMNQTPMTKLQMQLDAVARSQETAAVTAVQRITAAVTLASVTTAYYAQQFTFGTSLEKAAIYSATSLSAMKVSSYSFKNGVAPVRLYFRNALAEGHDSSKMIELQAWLTKYKAWDRPTQQQFDASLTKATLTYLKEIDVRSLECFDCLTRGPESSDAAADAFLSAPGIRGFAPFVSTNGKLEVDPRNVARSLELLQRTLSDVKLRETPNRVISMRADPHSKVRDARYQSRMRDLENAMQSAGHDAKLQEVLRQHPSVRILNSAAGDDDQRVKVDEELNKHAATMLQYLDVIMSIATVVTRAYMSEGTLAERALRAAKEILSVLRFAGIRAEWLLGAVSIAVVLMTGSAWITHSVYRRCARGARAALLQHSEDCTRTAVRLEANEELQEYSFRMADSLAPAIKQQMHTNFTQKQALLSSNLHIVRDILMPQAQEDADDARALLSAGPAGLESSPLRRTLALASALDQEHPTLVRDASESTAASLALDPQFQQDVTQMQRDIGSIQEAGYAAAAPPPGEASLLQRLVSMLHARWTLLSTSALPDKSFEDVFTDDDDVSQNQNSALLDDVPPRGVEDVCFPVVQPEAELQARHHVVQQYTGAERFAVRGAISSVQVELPAVPYTQMGKYVTGVHVSPLVKNPDGSVVMAEKLPRASSVESFSDVRQQRLMTIKAMLMLG
jgi:hypothetical protein